MNCFTVCEKLLFSHQKEGRIKVLETVLWPYLNLRNIQQTNERTMTDFLHCAVYVVLRLK